MTEVNDGSVSYLESVAEILYGDPEGLTQEQHSAVIERGINPDLDFDSRSALFEYARTRLEDPEVRNLTLLKLATGEAEAIDFFNGPQDSQRDKNRGRFDLAHEVAVALIQDGLISDQIAVGTLKLVTKLESGITGSHKGGRYYSSGASGDSVELANMAVTILETIQSEFPDAVATVGTVDLFYIGQIDFLAEHYSRDQEQVNGLVGEALPLMETRTENIVSKCLNLLSRTEDAELRKEIRATAVRLTAESDRTPSEVQIEPQGLFKRFVQVKSVPGPSEFDLRLFILEDEIGTDRKLADILNSDPDFVPAVVGLHAEGSRGSVWRRHADTLAGLAFTNGHYRVDDIKQIMSTVERFKAAAPQPVGDYAMETVKQRLAQSTPASN